MEKWEYKIQFIGSEDIEPEVGVVINELGKEGWELCASFNGKMSYLLFKRLTQTP